MKKKTILATLVLVYAIAGCGADKDAQKTEAEPIPSFGEALTTEEQTDSAAQTVSVEPDPVPEETPEENTPEEEQDAGPDPAGAALHLPEDAVENNGSFFVRVGDQVWFRRQEKLMLTDTALFGGFLTQPASAFTDMPLSTVCVWDLAAGACRNMFDDEGGGYGPLYYDHAGSFYSSRYWGDEEDVYRFSTDGSEVQRLCAGKVVDITEKGAVVVTRWTETYEQELAIYCRGEETASLSAGKDTITYCGNDGQNVYFILHRSEEEDDRFLALSDAGESCDLGAIPAAGYDMAMAWPECEDFLAVRGSEEGTDRVYLLATRYEGTGHFVQERCALAAIPGEEGSLTEVKYRNAMGDAFEEPAKLSVTEDGAVSLVPHRTGDLVLSQASCGDLMLCESPSAQKKIVADYLPEAETVAGGSDLLNPGISAGTGELKLVEDLTWLGGTAFSVMALSHRSEEDDIGWREAYALDALEYYATPVLDFHTGEELTVNGRGAELFSAGG